MTSGTGPRRWGNKYATREKLWIRSGRKPRAAFRKAQPFANPPRGLANDRGEIGFMFGFYLEVGSGLQIFRGPTPP